MRCTLIKLSAHLVVNDILIKSISFNFKQSLSTKSPFQLSVDSALRLKRPSFWAIFNVLL